jgi:hypothetical protein
MARITVLGICMLLQRLTDPEDPRAYIESDTRRLRPTLSENNRQLELIRRLQMTKRRKLTLATILAFAFAGIAATEASAAPVNGRAITTAAPTLTTEVQYWRYPGYSNWGYPGYSYRVYPGYSYWGYPGYSNWAYGGYRAYRPWYQTDRYYVW